MLKNYKELKVWQKSYRLCLEVYKITSKLAKEQRFGLTLQLRGSAVSMPSNMAEGYGRKTTADYIRSLYIAYGSNCELKTQILLPADLDYFENGVSDKIKDEIHQVDSKTSIPLIITGPFWYWITWNPSHGILFCCLPAPLALAIACGKPLPPTGWRSIGCLVFSRPTGSCL